MRPAPSPETHRVTVRVSPQPVVSPTPRTGPCSHLVPPDRCVLDPVLGLGEAPQGTVRAGVGRGERRVLGPRVRGRRVLGPRVLGRRVRGQRRLRAQTRT